MSKAASDSVSLAGLNNPTPPARDGVGSLGTLAAELVVRALAVSLAGAGVFMALLLGAR
jgi:hypothetical protein